MAGHSSFETTHRFYLAVRNDILDRARAASSQSLDAISVANLLQINPEDHNEESLPSVSD